MNRELAKHVRRARLANKVLTWSPRLGSTPSTCSRPTSARPPRVAPTATSTSYECQPRDDAPHPLCSSEKTTAMKHSWIFDHRLFRQGRRRTKERRPRTTPSTA
ncbi:hypothetical protein GY45DRAFT_1324662 [Cubamyces sp. BRFM 1775]|nr:hypothetical protein GY45DRAFT_1324662 [Cubamyces sp. BRFM 1775]